MLNFKAILSQFYGSSTLKPCLFIFNTQAIHFSFYTIYVRISFKTDKRSQRQTPHLFGFREHAENKDKSILWSDLKVQLEKTQSGKPNKAQSIVIILFLKSIQIFLS